MNRELMKSVNKQVDKEILSKRISDNVKTLKKQIESKVTK